MQKNMLKMMEKSAMWCIIEIVVKTLPAERKIYETEYMSR